jgi:D-amino-acid dehydrogenase
VIRSAGESADESNDASPHFNSRIVTKKVLVLGGGVIGLSAAYYAARRGFEVTLLDRNPEQRDGCSFGNAGMIVPSHFIPLAAPGMVALGLKWMWNPESPFYVKPRLDADLFRWALRFWRAATESRVRQAAPLLRDLSFASRACFEELASLPEAGFGLVQKGLLMLCKTQPGLDEEAATAQRARALGIPAEVLDVRATAQLEPGVQMDVAGSVYFPRDCHLAPQQFMAALELQLRQLGVRCVWNTEATGWRLQDQSIVALHTTRGEFCADEYVLCGGSWSPLLVRDLRLALPMQAGKGYSLTLPKPRQLPQICSIFTEARVAVTPMGSALRFGGTMELAGLNEDINPRRVRGIINAVPRYYPRFQADDFKGVPPWRGLRPCSPDGLPYLGRPARYRNLVVATGHAMMGLSLGPITGKLTAEILAGEPVSIPLGLLSPDRYG